MWPKRSLSTAVAVLTILALGTPVMVVAGDLPAGYWSLAETRSVLDRALVVDLAPDLSGLSSAEREAIQALLAAGRIFNQLYELQRHHQASSALAELRALAAADSESHADDLLDLYGLALGPIATTVDNQRRPFLPVAPEVPGKNVYPLDVEREELEAVLATKPGSRARLLAVRSVVRRQTDANRGRDAATLERYPALAHLHPEFAARLSQLGDEAFYAAPYAVAYATELHSIYDLLRQAAAAILDEDPEFAGYLENRARDLISGDYESGDASWVTGRFGNLNAQIGSYETYDDSLFGVKAFYGMSLLVRDREKSDALAAALGNIQAIEDSLPYEVHKQVRSRLPVGVYNVIADFGQARSANTATILPNDPEYARKYGRTILLRYNVLTHPQLFEIAQARFKAALAPRFHDDLTLEAGFQRTLWHEIGHYLGVGRTQDGRDVGEALERFSDLFEEMKSDLVSLFAARALEADGYYTAAGKRGVYASGVLRVLQRVKPRRAQPYQTMQLMQWNYFLEHGLLSFDADAETLEVDYDRYHEVVAGLLAEVLAIQRAGDPDRAEAFVERYGGWQPGLHEVIGSRVDQASPFLFRRMSYAALQ